MSLSALFLLDTFIQRPVALAVSDADGITQALSPSVVYLIISAVALRVKLPCYIRRCFDGDVALSLIHI